MCRVEEGRSGMSRIQKRRGAPELQPPADERRLERAVRQQMAWAAGTEYFQHRDPLFHVTESFQQTFDALGRGHARQAAGKGPEEEAQPQGRGRPEQAKEMPDPLSARSFYERSGERDMLLRFSETAFQRGTLSAAVLRGTGRMMLFSCLKKTVGQSQPVKNQQRTLFEASSQARGVPGRDTTQAVFNRGFTDSAVGLVVDTLRDARRTVTDMQELLRGGLDRTEAGAHGADTLERMYPFLDDSRERELLARYHARLSGPEPLSAGEKGLLQNAADRARALVDKKAQMRTEFINKLRFISDRAGQALEELEEPGFAEELDAALRESAGTDGGEGGADGGAADPGQDGAEAGTGPASGGAEQGAGAAPAQ